MPSTTHSHGLDVGHPAPQRHHANPALLAFGLVGAPAGWMIQLLFAFASTSYICADSTTSVIPGWLAPAIIGLNFAALAIATAALTAAVVLLKRTAHEHQQRSGGVLDAGEGRTRFLAVWCIFISLVFLVATLANSLCLFLVQLCRT